MVAWREPECFHDVAFSLLGSTQIALAKSDPCMGGGQIPIQRQCPLTFGNALGGAFGENMDNSHQAMRPRVIGRVGKYLSQGRFDHPQRRRPVDQHGRRTHGIDVGDAHHGFDIGGVQQERLLEERACLRQARRVRSTI